MTSKNKGKQPVPVFPLLFHQLVIAAFIFVPVVYRGGIKIV